VVTFYRGIPKLPYILGPRSVYMKRQNTIVTRGQVTGDKFDLMVTFEEFKSHIAFGKLNQIITAPNINSNWSKNADFLDWVRNFQEPNQGQHVRIYPNTA
jgi:hypothetical protein